MKGEDVVGIARAFLAAGARSVLVSLWAIDDEATMVFMKSFYQHLNEGKTACAGVHETMKSLRESEKFSEMRYCAPFQLIGDDVEIEIEADDFVSVTTFTTDICVYYNHNILRMRSNGNNNDDNSNRDKS